VKLALSLPGWASVVVAVGTLVGVVGLTHPDGLSGACLDVHQAADLNRQLSDLATEKQQLDDQDRHVFDRMAAKEMVVHQLCDGQIDLLTAARQFAKLNGDDATAWNAMRCYYGDRPVDELAALAVIRYAESRQFEHTEGYQLPDRLRREFEARYGRYETTKAAPTDRHVGRATAAVRRTK
jgi:hypothetical protein